MDRPLSLGVIFGGRSGEHEVSLMSARSILAVLDPAKYTVTQIGITRDGAWVTGPDVLTALEQGRTDELADAVILPETNRTALHILRDGIIERVVPLDVVFPILHGTFGEDGALQGLLEMAALAYVGAGVLASSVGMDKALFKDVMRANGIPVTPSILILRADIHRDMPTVVARCENLAPYPLFTKPANLGSSVGISKCHNRAELIEGILAAARYDRRILVERAVPNAREIEVSVLGNEHPLASPPGEIQPGDEFYTYDAKYFSSNSVLTIPAALDTAAITRLQELAIQVYTAVDCAGMARVDFLIDEVSADIFVSEINTIPGFTHISMYPKLWQAGGIPYPQLIDRLIELALERKADRDHTERSFRRAA
jgi:D-alanine-D-alanine ligase